jgi:hypothetical protein
MSKKLVGPRNKKILLFGVPVVLVILTVAAYPYYQAWQKGRAVQANNKIQETHDQSVSEVNAMGFRGDRALAASYVEQIKKNNTSAAAKLYTDKVNAESNVSKKVALYNQEIILASHYKMYDHAISAALAVDSLRSSFVTLSTIARLYGLKGDTAQQVSYLRKTIAALDDLPDSADAKSMREDYQAQLSKIEGASK